MHRLKKLKNGVIIFVKNINSDDQVVHGYNINAEKLRQKNFSFSEIDETWEEDVHESQVALKTPDRSKLDYTTPEARLTLLRYTEVETYINQLKNKNQRHYYANLVLS